MEVMVSMSEADRRGAVGAASYGKGDGVRWHRKIINLAEMYEDPKRNHTRREA